MKSISTWAVALVLGVTAPALADGNHPQYQGSPGFNKLKQLSGLWVGTIDMGQGPQKITTRFRVTSAGSALVETTFEGTPHEMVTVYHEDARNGLGLTHYCGLNNRPEMTLIREAEDALEFDLSADAPIDTAQPHMHALTVLFTGPDALTQRWTQYHGGKTPQVVDIVFSREKD